jgi:hypothetical protein
MWEIFSGGKSPYPGTDPLTLIKMLKKNVPEDEEDGLESAVSIQVIPSSVDT